MGFHWEGSPFEAQAQFNSANGSLLGGSGYGARS
jgi:hypothetical protein